MFYKILKKMKKYGVKHAKAVKLLGSIMLCLGNVNGDSRPGFCLLA